MLKRMAAAALFAVLVATIFGCNEDIPPDFRVLPSESSVEIYQGDSASVGITISAYGNFRGNVDIDIKLPGGKDLPPGITYEPHSIKVDQSTVNFELTISASDTAPVGSYNAGMTFSSGKINHGVGFSITVRPPAGSLDENFASNGVAVINDVTQSQGEDDLAYSVAFGNNRSLYVLGRSNDHLIAYKINTDGTLDQAFAGNNVYIDLGQMRPLDQDTLDFDLDRAIKLFFGGNYVVTGYVYDDTSNNPNDDLLIASFDPDGNLLSKDLNDSLVADSGLENVNDRGYTIMETSNGYAIAGMGYQNGDITEQLTLTRSYSAYDDQGNLQHFFETSAAGGEGYQSAYSLTRAITADASEGYFAVGETSTDSGRTGYWARFDSNGALVGSGNLDAFAGGRVRSVIMSNDGGYLLAGYKMGDNSFDLVVEKLKADGTPDPSFGENGVVVLDNVAGSSSPGADRAFSLIQDQNDRILVAGRSFVSGQGDDLIVVRLNPDGSLDEKFGTNGVFTYDGGNGPLGNDGAFEITFDPYGMIVVVGYTTNADGDYDTLALRLNP